MDGRTDGGLEDQREDSAPLGTHKHRDWRRFEELGDTQSGHTVDPVEVIQ